MRIVVSAGASCVCSVVACGLPGVGNEVTRRQGNRGAMSPDNVQAVQIPNDARHLTIPGWRNLRSGLPGDHVPAGAVVEK